MAGLFDFLAGNTQAVDPEGFAGPQDGLDASFNAGGAGAGITNFLDDPNNQRLMAEMGTAFSQGKPAGEAIGVPTSKMIKSRAFQEAGAKQAGNQGDMMKRLIKLMQGEAGNELVGDAEDLNTANSFTVDPNGITVKYPNKSPKPQFKIPGAEKKLEGIESFKPPSELDLSSNDGLAGGNDDLLGFLTASQV